MTRHTDRHHVTRLEVIDTGRRRRWTTEEKVRIVEESLAGRHQGCVVARRYGIASSQLFGWRKAYREGRLRAGQEPGVSFLEARVVPDQPGAAEYDAPPGGGPQGRMEIVVRTGRRVIVGADVDAAALARVVAVLEGL